MTETIPHTEPAKWRFHQPDTLENHAPLQGAEPQSGAKVKGMHKDGSCFEISAEEFEALKREGRLVKLEGQEALDAERRMQGQQAQQENHGPVAGAQGHGHIRKISPDGSISDVSDEEFQALLKSGKLRKLTGEEAKAAMAQFEAHDHQPAQLQAKSEGQAPVHPYEHLLTANGFERPPTNYAGQDHPPGKPFHHGVTAPSGPQISQGVGGRA